MNARRWTLMIAAPLAMTLLAGCTQGTTTPGAKRAPRTQRLQNCQEHTQTKSGNAQIHMTGMLLNTPDDQLIHVDFKRINPAGISIPPYLPVQFNHDVTFHVADTSQESVHDYDVQMGPYPVGEMAEGGVCTSVASFFLAKGWAFLTNNLPVGETELVGTSSEGTMSAMRVVPDANPNRTKYYIFNLERPGGDTIYVYRMKYVNDKHPIPPGHQIVVTKQTPWPPTPKRVILKDPFYIHMMRHIQATGLYPKAREKRAE